MAKKTKKNVWKNSEKSQEIEKGLHQVRQEKIAGGLFFEDRLGDDKVRNSIKNKTLNVDLIIKGHEANSAIGFIMSRKSLKKTSVPLKEGGKKEISVAIKKKIHDMALKKKAAGLGPGSFKATKLKRKIEKKTALKKAKGGFDLWEEKETKQDENSYLSQGPKTIARPKMEGSRPNAVPAVALPMPGISYQPDPKDHQDAIIAAADEEIKKIEEKEKIVEKLSYPPELDLLADEDFFESSSEDEDEQEENMDQAESNDMIKEKKVARKLTRVERNKQAKHKRLLRDQMTLKEQKSLIKQINLIKELERDINQKEESDKQRRLMRQEMKAIINSKKPKKLSRYGFKPTPMEIQLGDEIADSLRTLKPEGNLVKDRFQSLEARNMIETRVPVSKKRRYKRKEVESHDYKRFK